MNFTGTYVYIGAGGSARYQANSIHQEFVHYMSDMSEGFTDLFLAELNTLFRTIFP